MANKIISLVIHLFAIISMIGCFALLMASMLTHAWRGTETLLAGTDYYHGLWSQCSKALNQDAVCDRIDSDGVEDKRADRGNATRGLLAASLFFTFISIGLSVLNLCIRKKNMHKYTHIMVAFMLGVAFICGIASLASFTDFFGGESFNYKTTIQTPQGPFVVSGSVPYEWRYSWKLGWAGSVLHVIPVVLTIVEAFTYKKDLA